MHRFANPLRYQRIADGLLAWAGGLAVVLGVLGLYLALIVAPPDYQQGQAYRIMFVHVPAAWMALMVYAMMAVASADRRGLAPSARPKWRRAQRRRSGRRSPPLALVTGSLWGKPMWGTFWVWDAPLTSVLILLFLYLGYIALHDAFDDPARGARAASILCLVGSVNLPIIKFSVDWWNTLHQPSVDPARGRAPRWTPSMLWPLLVMWLAFLCYFVAVHILRTRAELTARKIRNLRLSADPAA